MAAEDPLAYACIKLNSEYNNARCHMDRDGLFGACAQFFCVLIVLVGLSVERAEAISPIYVDGLATGGDGSQGNPWTGWDGGTWSSGVPYYFRAGWFAYSATPASWSQSGMILRGTPGTVLQYTGSGRAVEFVGTGGIGGIVFEDFIIDGNGTATDGLYIERIGRSRFDNIRIRNVTTTGFNLVFNVLNTFTNPRVSEPTGTTSAMPSTLMLFDALGAGNSSSANTIINPVLENVPGATGILMQAETRQNVIIGGTVEGVGTGISICPDLSHCRLNTFTGIDLEANTVADLIVSGSESNQFNNVLFESTPPSTNGNGGYTLELKSNSSNNQFIGGKAATILERGLNNSFINIGTHWSGVDSYRRSAAFINVRDLGNSSSRTLLPANTSVGPSGQGFQNTYVVSASLTFSTPGGVPGISERSVFVNNSVLAGDAVTVSYNGAMPSNFVLSGYVDPTTPRNVVVRWTQISGSPTAPPSGTYKVVVMQ
jgi:hypothetical protein